MREEEVQRADDLLLDRVDPDDVGEPDVERLWDAVATATRLDEPDPVAAWRAMRIVYVVGTRPNLVKTAPVVGALRWRLPDDAPGRRPKKPLHFEAQNGERNGEAHCGGRRSLISTPRRRAA